MLFRHTPDGHIYLDEFQMMLVEFVQQRPDYVLPAPYISRQYDGRLHILSDGRNQSNGPVPWGPGDEYLANAAAIIEAVSQHRPLTERFGSDPGVNVTMIPNYQALFTEFQNDPAHLGYLSGISYAQIADRINAMNFSKQVMVPMSKVLQWAAANGVLTILQNIVNTSANPVFKNIAQAAMIMIQSGAVSQFDTSDPLNQQMLTALSSDQSTGFTQAMATSLLALGTVPASRAQLIFPDLIGTVTATDCQNALTQMPQAFNVADVGVGVDQLSNPVIDTADAATGDDTNQTVSVALTADDTAFIADTADQPVQSIMPQAPKAAAKRRKKKGDS